MRFQINGMNVMQASINLPQKGSWVIDARLDTILPIAPLAPMTLTADDVPVFAGEVSRSSLFAERTRVVCQPRGHAALSAQLAPVFIASTSKSQLAQQLAGIASCAVSYVQSDASSPLENVVMPSSINAWQVLRRYIGPDIRMDAQSKMVIGTVPAALEADFDLMDYSALAGIVNIAIGGTSFLVEPSNVWQQYSVIGVTYEIGTSQTRATLRVPT